MINDLLILQLSQAISLGLFAAINNQTDKNLQVQWPVL
jgi:hypothetical protein